MYLRMLRNTLPSATSNRFKQFTSKPAKYGLLLKSINAVRCSYTFATTPYCGKPRNQPTAYYTPGTKNVAKYLFMLLQKHVNVQERNISFDRLYTSILLAKWLLSNKLYNLCGHISSKPKGHMDGVEEWWVVEWFGSVVEWFGKVVEWLKRRADDHHGFGSKPTCVPLLCPWKS